MHERETGTRARNKTRQPVFSSSSLRLFLSLFSPSLTSMASFFGFTLRSSLSLSLSYPSSSTAAPVLIYTRYVCARRFFSQFLEICKKLVGHSGVRGGELVQFCWYCADVWEIMGDHDENSCVIDKLN